MGEYYGNNDWRDYLAHYGVKGMKWRKHKRAKDALSDAVEKIRFKGSVKVGDRITNGVGAPIRSRLRRLKGSKKLLANKIKTAKSAGVYSLSLRPKTKNPVTRAVKGRINTAGGKIYSLIYGDNTNETRSKKVNARRVRSMNLKYSNTNGNANKHLRKEKVRKKKRRFVI